MNFTRAISSTISSNFVYYGLKKKSKFKERLQNCSNLAMQSTINIDRITCTYLYRNPLPSTIKNLFTRQP